MKIKSPFEGYPKTSQALKKGQLVFTIRPHFLTPMRARFADFLAGVSVCYWVYILIISFEGLHITNGWLLLAYWTSPFFLHPLIRKTWQITLSASTVIEMSADHFRTRKWMGWTTYDRSLPHNFSLIKHDLTKIEQAEHEFEVREAQMKGKAIMKRPYYAESFHLIYEYLGQRNDVIEIYGHIDALAVVTRLKACDDILNAQSSMGTGTVLTPEDQWDDQPGDIDDLE